MGGPGRFGQNLYRISKQILYRIRLLCVSWGVWSWLDKRKESVRVCLLNISRTLKLVHAHTHTHTHTIHTPHTHIQPLHTHTHTHITHTHHTNIQPIHTHHTHIYTPHTPHTHTHTNTYNPYTHTNTPVLITIRDTKLALLLGYGKGREGSTSKAELHIAVILELNAVATWFLWVY
jgi:hypothetical protein